MDKLRWAITGRYALALAVVSLVAAVSGQAPAKPSASRAKTLPLPVLSTADKNTALGTICNASEPGSAARQITGLDQKETLSGYVSTDRAFLHVVLLAASYWESGAARHVFVTGKYDLEGGEITESRGHTIGLCAGLLEFRGGQWATIAQAPQLTKTRQGGDPPEVLLRQIGATRHAIELVDTLFAQDGGSKTVRIYEAKESGFAELIWFSTANDECDAARKCSSFRGQLDYRPLAGSPVYDLRITLRGTYKNEGGTIERVPPSPLVLRLSEGTYQLTTSTAPARAVWKAMTTSAVEGQ